MYSRVCTRYLIIKDHLLEVRALHEEVVFSAGVGTSQELLAHLLVQYTHWVVYLSW